MTKYIINYTPSRLCLNVVPGHDDMHCKCSHNHFQQIVFKAVPYTYMIVHIMHAAPRTPSRLCLNANLCAVCIMNTATITFCTFSLRGSLAHSH